MINLVTIINGYSYLISLEVDVAYRKLKSFQGTQVKLRVLKKNMWELKKNNNNYQIEHLRKLKKNIWESKNVT